MTAAQSRALAQIRDKRNISVRELHRLLVTNGLPPRKLSRQRLGRVVLGEAELPAELWEAIADALLAIGIPAAEVARVQPAAPAMKLAPANTPDFRRNQWLALANRLPVGQRWKNIPKLIGKLAGLDWQGTLDQLQRLQLAELDKYLELAKRSLELGGKPAGKGVRQPGDAVELEGNVSTRIVRLRSQEVHVFRQRLHNTGTVEWRNRLLYRLGPPVTSTLPFTPPLIPILPTAPGETCEISIPCRAQKFSNLAIVSYVMVFADCSMSLPGRLTLHVDTRGTDTFSTIDLPQR
jgi:hypothetical protein